jgi:hypothetical protein
VTDETAGGDNRQIRVRVRVGGTAGFVHSGGHTAHTGDILVAEAVSQVVEALAPHRWNSSARVLLGGDPVYGRQQGNRAFARAAPIVPGRPRAGYGVAITLAVDPATTPASVGIR